MYLPMLDLADLLTDLPIAIVGIDPDDRHTALCLCVRVGARTYEVRELLGGGSGKTAVPWGSITGALTWLRETSECHSAPSPLTTLVVEAQTAWGAHSECVEGCRRARWHWDAAGELSGARRVHLAPGDWEGVFVPAGSEWRAARSGPGAIKLAYQARARTIDKRATNEDRAAALGIAWVYVQSIGAELRGSA